MSYIGKINAGGTAYNVGSTLYGTCETAADTAAKVAVINGFDTLETGVTVHIKFTYSNTASSPTLAIKTSSSATSTTTAKSIKKCGTTAPGTTAATSWQAGAVVSFTYDGTNWQMNDHQDGAGADSDEKVKQSPVSTNANYELLLSNSANNNEETNKVGKDSGAIFNPSLKAVTFGNRLNNSATGSYSSARGYNVYASGSYAHAEGNTSGATGESSHAEGYNAQATGTKSHAEGESTTASGNYSSHAEGRNTTASGSYGSHAEGNGSTASADCAHAEGSYATASGSYSHAEGNFTTAQRKSQHVFGEYNVLDTTGANGTVRGSYVEIVGNGTGSSARSNARTLDWSGNEVLAGGLTTNGDIILKSSYNPTTNYLKYDYSNNNLMLKKDEAYTFIDTGGINLYNEDIGLMQITPDDILVNSWDGVQSSLKAVLPIVGSNNNYHWIKFPSNKSVVLWGRKTATYTGKGNAQSITLNNYPFTLTNPVTQVTGNLAGVVDTQVLYVNTTGTNAEVYVRGSTSSNVTATLYVTVYGTYS